MAKIKICGLSRHADITMVNEALPDYIGFVFAKSKRKVSVELAQDLKSGLNPAIQAVGVFVNEEIDRIVQICNKDIINLVQLHGDEGDDYIHELKERITIPVMKAVRVRSREDIRKASGLSCDYLLLDAYQEGEYGGCGKTFDWSEIRDVGRPFFLAGGINPDNVVQAVTRVKPYAVDVSSGVETDGWKDKNKITDIISKVRSVRSCQKEDSEFMEDSLYRKH